jgi:flavin reductase (DIM6/NTAB) family NADH-FMN oxidoreductase RutF
MSSSTPDPRAFRDTLGLFATGVSVVATQIEGQVHAMTANAVSSLSLDPPLVLFCPSKRARFSRLLAQAVGFSVNFLRDEQEALSTYFAGFWQEPEPPRYRFVPVAGLPRLEGSLASLLCDKRDVYEAGDHWLVTLQVRQLHRGIEPLRPLLFFRGKYQGMDATDGKAAPDIANTADEPVQMYYHE